MSAASPNLKRNTTAAWSHPRQGTAIRLSMCAPGRATSSMSAACWRGCWKRPAIRSITSAYIFDDDKALFSADALFSIGCGRVFEGTYPMMWESLLKLRALPDDLRVYCGHEYTASNVKFALTIEPNNEALKERAEKSRSFVPRTSRPFRPARRGKAGQCVPARRRASVAASCGWRAQRRRCVRRTARAQEQILTINPDGDRRRHHRAAWI